MFDLATKIWFQRVEGQLKKALNAGDRPFLGLYADNFKDNARQYFRKKLITFTNPFNAYIQGLQRWPAVFATYLTIHVVEEYGRTGNHAVHPYVERAVTGGNTYHLTQAERERLWKSYRSACLYLGLSVSVRQAGTNYIIEEYLRQTGVPTQYVPELTRRMIHYSQDAGLPEDDDPAAIKLWQQGLLERFRTGISITVPRAIVADDIGYYVRLFLRILSAPNQIEPEASTVEKLMAQAVLEQLTQAPNREKIQNTLLIIPQIVWHDEELRIELPPGEHITWYITERTTEGENIYEYVGRGESRLVPFESTLPSSLIIRDSQNRLERTFNLWGDGRNNHLLIFSAQGRLISSTCLGTSEPVALEPGEYVLLMRFLPTGCENEITQISHDPDLYLWCTTLDPGEQVGISRGPAALALKADAKPLLKLTGRSIREVRGNEIYLSQELYLQVILPEEMAQLLDPGFKIRLDPGCLGEALDDIELPIGETTFQLDLKGYLYEWKPGVTRLLAELHRRDSQRPLARTAIMLWNGLVKVENRSLFRCSSLPTNLDEFASENLSVDRKNSVIEFRDEGKRFFRIVFDLGNSRRYTSTWAVPGIFLYLKDYQGSTIVERPLRKGAVLAVRGDSREVLEVYATTNGYLELGEFRQTVDFSRIGAKRLHLSGLVEYLIPGVDTLQFQAEGMQTPEPLVRLLTPHQVLGFRVERDNCNYRLQFDLLARCEALQVRATNLINGATYQIDLQCNEVNALTGAASRAWLGCDHPDERGSYRHELVYFLERWEPGGWLLELEAKLGGRWGKLSNSRQDTFGGGFLIGIGGTSIKIDELPISLAQESVLGWLAIFKRVHRVLLPCYAPEAWSDLEWLAELWGSLAERFSPQDGQVLVDLVVLAEESPPETVSSSWIPLRSVAARLPWIFARHRTAYRGLSGRNGLISAMLYIMATLERPLLQTFQQDIFDAAAVAGFANFRQFAIGQAEPKGFNFSRYRQSLHARDLSERLRLLRQEGWRPGPGDYLGPLHYRYALQNLRQNYKNSLSGNEIRRGHTLFILKQVGDKQLSNFATNYPSHLDYSNRIGLFDSEITEEISQEEQNVFQIIHFLDLFAQICRWEARCPGALQQFRHYLNRFLLTEHQLHEALGYLFFIGVDLLVFHLLLWELIFLADADTLDA